MKRKHLAALAILVLAGLFTAWWLSPTQVLKRRTSNLLDTLNFSGESGGAFRQMRGYAFSSYLAERVELDTPEIPEANGSFDRGTLESGYSGLASRARESEFSVVEFHTVEIDGDEANVTATVAGMVQLPTHRPVDGRYRVDLDWRRHEDGWRLVRASWREDR